MADNFFGMSLEENTLIPNADAFAKLPEKERYACEIKVSEIKAVRCALDKNKGMMAQVQNLVFEYTITLTGPQHADEPAVQEGSVFLPIAFAEGAGYTPTREERAKLQDKITRAEEKLAGLYAYISLPMVADPKAGDRLAPQGNFLSSAGWSEIKGHAIPAECWISVDGNGNRWTNYKVKARM